MRMVLNGRPYAFNDIQPGERIPLDTVQLMEIFHAHGGNGGHGDQAAAKPAMQHDQEASASEGGHKMGGMGMMRGMQHGEGDKPQAGGGRRMGMMGMRHGNEDGDHKMGGMGMGGMMGKDGGGMGMMMSMAHPIHLHGQYFQIFSRSLDMAEGEGYATVKDGFIEGGWKDTVLVMPGERVKIIKPFEDFKGLFMYHCHNLEHEDMGMMRDFLVE
jgi:hypothetical protein